jgi:hypothetical protein
MCGNYPQYMVLSDTECIFVVVLCGNSGRLKVVFCQAGAGILKNFPQLILTF